MDSSFCRITLPSSLPGPRDGAFKNLFVSPSGDQIVAYGKLIGPGGTIREFQPDWRPLGWLNREEIALAQFSYLGFKAAIADAATMKMRIVFP